MSDEPHYQTNQIIPTWKKAPAVARAHTAKVFLLLAGLITDAESARIHTRMLKWIAKSQAKSK